jgi:hypothetical protein
VTAVLPYFGYARADRKVHGRESIAAKLTANLLTEAGIDRMLSIDLHSGQCVGYFDIPVDHVYGESVLLDYLASKRIPNGSNLLCKVVVVRGMHACMPGFESLRVWSQCVATQEYRLQQAGWPDTSTSGNQRAHIKSSKFTSDKRTSKLMLFTF